MKNVYVEPAWKMHSLHQRLIGDPPEGYRFFATETAQQKISRFASKMHFSYSTLNAVDRFVPMNLVQASLNRTAKKGGPADLTYACGHLVYRHEPWVCDLEYVSLLAGYHASHIRKWKPKIERALASTDCKKVICWLEASRKSVLSNLDCHDFERKLETVYQVIPPRTFEKQPARDKVKLLFVGSTNIMGEFQIKGGREVLAVFALLDMKYKNLELVIRSDVPADVRRNWQGPGNIRLIEKRITWDELDKEFQTADIFFAPAHNTPFLLYFDAMSYELPIVAIEGWANAEIVQDGVTGFLSPNSANIPYYVQDHLPAFDTAAFRKTTSHPDPKVVDNLYQRLCTLIEKPELRRKMGAAARQEIEQGKFSVQKKKTQLKRIFDEATA